MRSEPAVPGQAVKVIRPEGGISGEARAVMGFRIVATSLRCTRQPQPAPRPMEDYVPKIKCGELIPHRRHWITFLQSSYSRRCRNMLCYVGLVAPKGGLGMRVTFSLFFLFTVTIGVLLFLRRLRVAAFLVSAVWGFLLAQTAAAPGVNNFLTDIARLFGAK
jgi:hypothetical protein